MVNKEERERETEKKITGPATVSTEKYEKKKMGIEFLGILVAQIRRFKRGVNDCSTYIQPQGYGVNVFLYSR